MRRYKGYYIDKVIFSSAADVDRFIKTETVNRYRILCRMFAEAPSRELVAIMEPVENRLHDLGFTFEEIENIEISAYQEV